MYADRLHLQHSRTSNFKPNNSEEMQIFFGLTLLKAQVYFPTIRKAFSNDPMYYHPLFASTMSGRRFEILLRTMNCSDDNDTSRLSKVNLLLNALIENFQKHYHPYENLSLDESLLLHKGRLSLRQYIKGKKAKYGIKFYELCSPNGYVHNIEIYEEKQTEDANNSKLEALVFSLMKPFINKSHHLVMDNYYNSLNLCEKCLEKNTHVT